MTAVLEPVLATAARALVFACVVSAVGCAHTPRPAEQHCWRDALLIDATPASRLVIEVDRVGASAPRARALAFFLDDLHRELDKPAGIEVILDAPIHESAWTEDPSAIRALAVRQRDHKPQRGAGKREAGLHLLYAPAFRQYRGYTWTRDSMSREAGRHDGALILVLTDRLKPILWLTRTMQERSVLIHELGHALGLVGDPSHGVAAHCTNASCVMYDGVDARSAARWLGPVLFAGRLPLRWCAMCAADLRPEAEPR